MEYPLHSGKTLGRFWANDTYVEMLSDLNKRGSTRSVVGDFSTNCEPSPQPRSQFYNRASSRSPSGILSSLDTHSRWETHLESGESTPNREETFT